MFCTDIPNPIFFIFSNSVPHLLYYSHIPSAIIALLLGFFVYFKTRKENLIIGKLLLFVSVIFFIWVFFDLILWTNNDSRLIIFIWSLINLLELLVSVSTLYFSYVFLSKKDVSFKIKLFFGILLLVYIVFIPTNFNLAGFTLQDCGVQQSSLFYYYYFLETFFFIWLLGYLIKKIVTAAKEERKITILFSIGAICFLLSFSGANILASVTEKWEILQYGLFGMPVFMAFLAYLIVQYGVFNIRLVAAQALVVAMIILIGSQFFFIQNPINRTLTAITLVLIIIFGWWLVRSVKKGERQKTELAIANAKLKRVDQMKSEFISIVSHQLRTPMTGIKGYLYMLTQGDFGKLPAPVQKILVEMRENTDKLIWLIRDFLDVSQIESETLKIRIAPAKIEPVIEKAIEAITPTAKKKGLEIIFEKPKGEFPKLNIDDDKTLQIVINLIDNAIKYTEKGQITISGKINQDKKEFILSVKDTGIGIEQKEANQLFQKFVRGRKISKIYPGGRGLGLYIVKMLAEAQRGRAWVESAGRGKGSTFFVELPVA